MKRSFAWWFHLCPHIIVATVIICLFIGLFIFVQELCEQGSAQDFLRGGRAEPVLFAVYKKCSCFDSLYGQIGLSRDKIKYPDRESPEFRSDSIKFHCKWRLPALQTRRRYNERT